MDEAASLPTTTAIEVSGKEIHIEHIDGPVDVHSRNFGNTRIYSLGWEAKVFLKEGIEHTYPWIEAQVKAVQEAKQKVTSWEQILRSK